MSEKTKKKFTELTDQLYQAMLSGPSKTLRNYAKAMRNLYTYYSFLNVLLISLQKPDATIVMGYKRWQKFRRYVKKGERAIWIIAPIIKKIKHPTNEHPTDTLIVSEEERADNNKPSRDQDKRNREDKVLVGFRFTWVFDITQTEGEPFSDPLDQVGFTGLAMPVSLEKAISRLRGAGIIVEIGEPALPGRGGYTDGRKIVLYQRKEAAMLSVLLHELVHYKLHFDEQRNIRKDVSQQQRELEAQYGSFLAGELLGLSSLEVSSDYLISYQVNPNDLFRYLNRAGKAAMEIVEMLTGKSFGHKRWEIDKDKK